jgi:hypothetical protein
MDCEGVAPHAFAISIPCSRALYSASLLEAFGKFNCKTYRILSPLGEMSTTLAPAPCALFEPSKYMEELDISGGPGVWISVHSAMKSGRTCDLMALRLS